MTTQITEPYAWDRPEQMHSWLPPAWLRTDQAVFPGACSKWSEASDNRQTLPSAVRGASQRVCGNTAVRWRLHSCSKVGNIESTHNCANKGEETLIDLLPKHITIYKKNIHHRHVIQSDLLREKTVSGAMWKFSFELLHIKLSWLFCLRSKNKTKPFVSWWLPTFFASLSFGRMNEG